MNQIIKAAVDRGASDIHIKSGDAFRARIHGKLVPLTKQSLTPEQTKQIALHLITNEEDKARIDKMTDYDCSWFADGIGRFRVNNMNQHSGRHILTLENPIEFLHKDINCAITQREIGSDTSDFKQGLKSALRQDPDVIMIGEMRDAETIDTAMKAAETGHLLISTLHTADALSTINRIMAMFSPSEQNIVRIRLAESLHAVISQRLIKRTDGKSRAVAAEVLINTPAVKDMIIDGQRISEIKDYMESSKEQYGMQSFDQALADLVTSKQISFASAMAAASKPADFELKLRMFSRMSSSIQMADVPDEAGTGSPPSPPQGTPALAGGGLDFIQQ